MYYKAKREYLFALPIDSEHIFCYLIENKKRTNVQNTVKRAGKENRQMSTRNRNTHRAARRNSHRKAHRKYRIKSNFRFITFVVIVLGLAIGAFGFITGSNDAIALDIPTDPVTVEVTAGDTVWDIAEHFKSDDTDTRKAVYEICQANDIQDGSIQSGMILTIPENL